MVEIKRVAAEFLYPIRLKVLREDSQEIEKAVFENDQELSSAHFLLSENGDSAGCVSVMKEKYQGIENAYRMRGLAVYEQFRGKKYAHALLKMAEFYVFSQQKADVLWLNARVSAIELYAKLGYERVGEVFFIDDVGDHLLMIKHKEQYKSGCCEG